MRLGIDFPLPGVSNVKQLPSSNEIPDSSDNDVTDTDTEQVVEAAVDSETQEEIKEEEDNKEEDKKVLVEEPEPCCDNLVSNTVELVNEVSEETSEVVSEDISGNVKYEELTNIFRYLYGDLLFEGV